MQESTAPQLAATDLEPTGPSVLLERGVHFFPYKSERGNPILFAVDSRGWMKGWIEAAGIVTVNEANIMLSRLLDAVDAPPALSLLR